MRYLLRYESESREHRDFFLKKKADKMLWKKETKKWKPIVRWSSEYQKKKEMKAFWKRLFDKEH